jgi:hypothetical protein
MTSIPIQAMVTMKNSDLESRLPMLRKCHNKQIEEEEWEEFWCCGKKIKPKQYLQP